MQVATTRTGRSGLPLLAIVIGVAVLLLLASRKQVSARPVVRWQDIVGKPFNGLGREFTVDQKGNLRLSGIIASLPNWTKNV